MQNLVLAALVTLGAMELALFFWVARSLRGQQRLEAKLAQLADAMSLLTETSEAGFRAGAVEIARIADLTPPRRTSPSRAAGRKAQAGGSRRTTRQAAGGGAMSEGEAHLRAQLRRKANEKAPAARRTERRKGTAGAPAGDARQA